MRRGAIKLGYIIVLIAIILSIYIPYSIGKAKEAQRREAIKRIYSYGDRVLNYIANRDSTKLQNEILIDGHSVDLERISLFLDTISLDGTILECKWQKIRAEDGNITIYGSIDSKVKPKRVDMMLIKSGKKLLVRAIHIEDNSLESSSKEFPFYESDNNISEVKGL